MNSLLPVLYSFRRCPYAMRARLAICYARVPVELREVVLRDMPATMLEVSPKATVPVLVLNDGSVIDESYDIMRWALEQSDTAGWLNALDENQLQQLALLIDSNDNEFKNHLDHYKYAVRFPEKDMVDYRAEAEKFLRVLEQRLQQHRYLLGEQLSLADMAIFPFIRQFAFVDKEWFDQSNYPALQQWLQRHLDSDLFAAVMNKHLQWQEGDEVTVFPA